MIVDDLQMNVAGLFLVSWTIVFIFATLSRTQHGKNSKTLSFFCNKSAYIPWFFFIYLPVYILQNLAN